MVDLGVGPERDVRVRADLGHLRRQDAGRAVEGGEGLVELGHVPADGGLALDQIDLLAGVGQGQGGVDAGDAAADDQHVGIDVDPLGLERLVMSHALNGGLRQRLGLLGGFLAVGVHPRVVLADVHHVEEERIQTRPPRWRRGRCARAGAGEQEATTTRLSLCSRMSCWISSWPGSEHMYL